MIHCVRGFRADGNRDPKASHHTMNGRAACLENMYFKLRRKPRRVPQGPEEDRNPPKPTYLTYLQNLVTYFYQTPKDLRLRELMQGLH
eukprot:3699363-Pleurochrysis_carterae.AAC.1